MPGWREEPTTVNMVVETAAGKTKVWRLHEGLPQTGYAWATPATWPQFASRNKAAVYMVRNTQPEWMVG